MKAPDVVAKFVADDRAESASSMLRIPLVQGRSCRRRRERILYRLVAHLQPVGLGWIPA